MPKAMTKAKTQYACLNCGAIALKWSGQCSSCLKWNTLEEQIKPPKPAANTRIKNYAGASGITTLGNVKSQQQIRIGTQIGELDRVLGGGIVEGSVCLLGGDPGIGKSTLLLQAMAKIDQQQNTLYVSGEESLQQIALRAQRLNIQAADLKLAAETQIETIIALASAAKPQVLVIDSIQTMHTELLQSAPGSVGQVRESAAQLVRFAKQANIAVLLVGHVTKDGQLAGPRVLEHMVDTVLYFEGDSSSRYRVIRAIKNRFGAVNELGVFAMSETGVKEVSNPSAIFLSRHESSVFGSVIMAAVEGTRPLLVEVQALVAPTGHNNPKRVTLGLDHNRLAMLLAVLNRHGQISIFDQDVFVNVVGGIRVFETAADLAVIIAVVSSLQSKAIAQDLLVFGELGLAGEVRPVPNGEARLYAAAKHGFKRAIVPAANAPKNNKFADLEITPVSRIDQVFDSL